MSHLEIDLEGTIKTAKHFTFRGFNSRGEYRIPKIYIDAIIAWSGSCTDPCDEGVYKNPEAMFEALDLIYKILEPVQINDEFQTSNQKVKTE